MAWSLKNIIFSLFGRYEKETDTFKDGNNKGVQERFNESVAEEYDEQHYPLVTGIQENTRVPLSAFERFLQYMESDRGIEALSGITEDQRRRMARFYLAIVARKGTRSAYDLLFRYIGFNVDALTEDFTGQTLDDDDLAFDEGNTFDSGGCGCTFYDLELSGDLPVTPDLYNFFLKAISFVEPVTIKLRDLLVNGIPLSPFYPFMLFSNRSGIIAIRYNGTVGESVNIDWNAPTEGFVPSISNKYFLNADATIDFIVQASRRHDTYFQDEAIITEIIADGQQLINQVNMGIFSALTRIEFQDNSIVNGFFFGAFASNDGLWADLSFNNMSLDRIRGTLASALANIQAQGGGNSQVIWIHNQILEFLIPSENVAENDIILSLVNQLFAVGCNAVHSYFTITDT